MNHDKLNEIAKEVKKLEHGKIAFQNLWQAAKDFLDQHTGKADEFIPLDIFEDNLRDALKRSKRFK